MQEHGVLAFEPFGIYPVMSCKSGKALSPIAKARIPLFLFALLAMTSVVCYAGEVIDGSVEASKSLTVARCAQIAALDPKFGPLAQACQYALSPNNLPSFECDESVQQFTSTSGPKDWQNLAVVTAVVTFEQGKGDRFSNVDGWPIQAFLWLEWGSSRD